MSQSVFYDENENEIEEPEECTSKGRKRSLEAREEFFIVLCRLKRGFAGKQLHPKFGKEIKRLTNQSGVKTKISKKGKPVRETVDAAVSL